MVVQLVWKISTCGILGEFFPNTQSALSGCGGHDEEAEEELQAVRVDGDAVVLN